MPYTPPLHQSPASSTPDLLNVNRRPYLQPQSWSSIPYSPLYLHRDDRAVSTRSLQINSLDSRALPRISDGTLNVREGRDWRLGMFNRLEDAVGQIPRKETPSLSSKGHTIDSSAETSQSTNRNSRTNVPDELRNSSCQNSHVRYSTLPRAILIQSADDSTKVLDKGAEDLKKKPQIVRKKTGALHSASRHRPGAPNFSKVVHFDLHLDNTRLFFESDNPEVINYQSDDECQFSCSSGVGDKEQPCARRTFTINFSRDDFVCNLLPVKSERVWLSADQKSILGSVAVASLAFQKYVTCRFTLDCWQTASEVDAVYSQEIRSRNMSLGYDRFIFSITMFDMAEIEPKTLSFCVRYSVNGQVFWDNNCSANFRVEFLR